MNDETVITEEEGIKLIIELQAVAGITESEAQAKAGWAAMSQSQKVMTQQAHSVVVGSKS